MTDESKPNIEILPEPEQDLTPEQAEEAQSGHVPSERFVVPGESFARPRLGEVQTPPVGMRRTAREERRDDRAEPDQG